MDVTEAKVGDFLVNNVRNMHRLNGDILMYKGKGYKVVRIYPIMFGDTATYSIESEISGHEVNIRIAKKDKKMTPKTYSFYGLKEQRRAKIKSILL